MTTETIKENILDFINRMQDGDKEGAASAIQSALLDKVSSKLEDLKVDVAQQYFNTSNESIEDQESIESLYQSSLNHESQEPAYKGEPKSHEGDFEKIADNAGKKYGSKKAGDRVAGAILAKMRAKHGE